MTQLEIVHYITGTDEYKKLTLEDQRKALSSVDAMRSLLLVREHNLRQQKDHDKADAVRSVIAGLRPL